jgi:hypothetical protein
MKYQGNLQITLNTLAMATKREKIESLMRKKRFVIRLREVFLYEH